MTLPTVTDIAELFGIGEVTITEIDETEAHVADGTNAYLYTNKLGELCLIVAAVVEPGQKRPVFCSQHNRVHLHVWDGRGWKCEER
jgi:hypothetical protein